MAVVIEELDVQAQPPAPEPASSGEAPGAGAALDERELRAVLAREAWRSERLAAD